MTGSIEQVMDQWMELLVYDSSRSSGYLKNISENLERIADVMESMEAKKNE
tara:strand:+ start:542 stop:694 length:153 start_codon:yes stop_codon:yes gene_type:complete